MLIWLATSLVQDGDSLFELAALLISTVTPPLVGFFSWQTYSRPMDIREAMAASDPMMGHFIFSRNDVDAGRIFSSDLILLLIKTVELTLKPQNRQNFINRIIDKI